MTVFLLNGAGIGVGLNILLWHRMVDCGVGVGFIPVPRSRQLLVCPQLALRFATALKCEAFSLDSP